MKIIEVTRRTAIASVAAATSALLVSCATPNPAPTQTLARPQPVTLFRPPADRPAPGALYARSLRLSERSGSGKRPLLVTFEQYVTTEPVFPIYRSDDEGQTWTRIGQVRDTQNGWGMRYQPFLYQLPVSFAGFPAGTLLCAGNSIPDDLSKTKIDLYASSNLGATWTFLSSVATGGKALPENGLTPVWEPFLLLHAGRLICYYSDQRDPEHGQKLVHQTSHDMRAWGPVVDDVASADPKDRPGMTTVAALPNGRWILTHEAGGDGDGEAFFAVHYRIASHPEAFGRERSTVLRDDTGYVPVSSPTVTWSAAGGPDGTVVVSAGSSSHLFVNRRLGANDAWSHVPSVVPAGYTRYVLPLDGARAFTVSAGRIGNHGHNLVVTGTDAIA